MRFYVDGIELDVQDPKFFIDEEKYKADFYAIKEILSCTSSIDSSAHSHSASSKRGESS